MLAAEVTAVVARTPVFADSSFSNRNLSLKASRRGIFLVVVEAEVVDVSPYRMVPSLLNSSCSESLSYSGEKFGITAVENSLPSLLVKD